MYCETGDLRKEITATSEIRAEDAVPRFSGSMERKVSSKFTALVGNSLHLSRRVLSYGCCGLNIVT